MLQNEPPLIRNNLTYYFVFSTSGRVQSDSQVTEQSIKSSVSELGTDNLAVQNEHAQGEAAL